MAHDIDPFEDLGWKTRQRKWNCPLSTGNSTLIFKIVSPKFEDLFRLITSFLAFRRNRLIFYLYSFTLSLLSFVNSYPKITLIYQRKKKKGKIVATKLSDMHIHSPLRRTSSFSYYYYLRIHDYYSPEEMATPAIRLLNDPVTGDDPNFWTLVRDSVVVKWDVCIPQSRATWTDTR